MIVTPFYSDISEATQDTGAAAEQQPFITEEPGADTVALRSLSSSSPIPLLTSRPVAPVARGLSDKDRALLRAGSAVAETGGAALPSDTQGLHPEVESLRRQMEQLLNRAEGLVSAPPPSYTEGDR